MNGRRKRAKAGRNKASIVETPKLKRFNIPVAAKGKIMLLSQALDNYIAGVAAGLGITGGWAFDMKNMQVVVREPDVPLTASPKKKPPEEKPNEPPEDKK